MALMKLFHFILPKAEVITIIILTIIICHNTLVSPTASILSTTDTTLSLSWSVPSGITVDSYEVMWQRDTTGECSNEDEGSATITDGSTSYTITGLEEYSNYTITVTAADISGSIISDPVTGTTNEAGEKMSTQLCNTLHLVL